MIFTPTIAVATVLAAAAAIMQTMQPESWMPFYRAEIAWKSKRSNTVAALLVGLVGQAATTAIIGMLVTILILSVVLAADKATAFWAGIAILLLSAVYVVRRFREPSGRWQEAERLIEAVRKSTPTADPFGPFGVTTGKVIRSSIFSPRFILAPMFLAASVSGEPSIGNALPVVIAYGVFSLVGALLVARLVAGFEGDGPLRTGVRAFHVSAAVAVAALGIFTAIAH